MHEQLKARLQFFYLCPGLHLAWAKGCNEEWEPRECCHPGPLSSSFNHEICSCL